MPPQPQTNRRMKFAQLTAADTTITYNTATTWLFARRLLGLQLYIIAFTAAFLLSISVHTIIYFQLAIIQLKPDTGCA